MKAILTLFLALILCISLNAYSVNARAETEVIVGVPASFPPHYLVEDGEPKGFAIDVMEEIAARAGLKAQYRIFPTWKQTLDALRSSEIDLIPNVGIFSERSPLAQYSIPYETFRIRIFVRADDPNLRSLDALEGAKIAVVAANAAALLVPAEFDLTPRSYLTIDDAFAALMNGEVRALVHPASTVYNVATSADYRDDIRIIGDPLVTVERAILVAPDKLALLDEIKPHLRDFSHSLAFDTVYRKWFQPHEPTKLPVSPWIVGLTVAAAFGMLLVVLFYKKPRLAKSGYDNVKHIENKMWNKTVLIAFATNILLFLSVIIIVFALYRVALQQKKDDLSDMLATSEAFIDSVARYDIGNLGDAEAAHEATLSQVLDGLGRITGESEVTIAERRGDMMRFILRQNAPNRFTPLEIPIESARVALTRRALDGKKGIDIAEDYRGVTVLAAYGPLSLLDAGLVIKEDLYHIQRPYVDAAIFIIVMFSAVSILATIGYMRIVANQLREFLSVESRFQLAAEAAGIGTWDYDIANDKARWDDKMFEIFGIDRDIFSGRLADWSRILHPADSEAAQAAVRNAIESEDGDFRTEFRIVRPNDGEVRHIAAYGHVSRHARTGEPVSIMGVNIDITEQRATERQLQQSQKLDAIGQMTGGIAHDFNNLLTVILGNLEVIHQQLADQAELRSLTEMTTAAADQAAQLTQQLLTFSRQQALEPEVIDLNDRLSKMESWLRRTIDETIDFRVAKGAESSHIEVDPAQLEAAILNLVINARDAMPDGGTITLETANTVIDEDYAAQHEELEPGPYVMLAVSDNGAGMSRETLAKVFDPFFTTKEVGKGTGLGLSMVYGFVKQSGGHITIYSEPGAGTTIRLYFRESHKAVGASNLDDDDATSRGGSEHILVVEDDEMVRRYLVSQLEKLGYKVLAAEDGDKALEVLKDHPDTDLLFTDVVMPGSLNGKELSEKAEELQPGLKVLFSSGYTEEALADSQWLNKGVHLLSKPYRRKELAAKVRCVLDE